MTLDKFTIKAQESISEANQIAIENDQQQIEPEFKIQFNTALKNIASQDFDKIVLIHLGYIKNIHMHHLS